MSKRDMAIDLADKVVRAEIYSYLVGSDASYWVEKGYLSVVKSAMDTKIYKVTEKGFNEMYRFVLKKLVSQKRQK